VVVGPTGSRAIFAGADGKSRAAAEGDAVGAFTVQAIGPGRVTLSGSDGDRVLRPTHVQVLGQLPGALTDPPATASARTREPPR
jgi:hypothetical protein